jgi:hypothetical protein
MSQSIHDRPIVCDLSADALARRREALSRGVLRAATSVDVVENGLRWQFTSADGLLADLTALIESERACCRFLAFYLRADPACGPVSLEVTGPPGTREFLETWSAAGAP